MILSSLCKDWVLEEKMALRRRDAQHILVKRAANLHLQRQIRKANYMCDLQHEERRIKKISKSDGGEFSDAYERTSGPDRRRNC